MMNRLALVLVAVMLAGASAMTAQPAAQADKLLAAAQHKATVEGDLKGAIELYRQIAARAGANRSLGAQALLAMAECHEKLGQRDAAVVYERIVREYADQGDSASMARARLSALQSGPRGATGQTVRQVWSGSGVDPMGTPSADGRYLSFTDWETGDLAVRDLSANTSRRLTNTGGWEASGDFSEFSVMSPDGRYVAYAWFIDKGPTKTARCVCRYELRVLAVGPGESGKPQVLLQSGENYWLRPAAFTPDGKQLVVVRTAPDRTYELGVVTLADASFRMLASLGWKNPDSINMSPDGRSIVYDVPASAESGGHDIVLRSLDGAQEKLIVQSPAHESTPVWSADGSHVLFISDRTGSEALWRLPMRGDTPSGPPVLALAAISGMSGLLGASRNGAVYYWAAGQNTNVYMADLDADIKARGAPRVAIERFLNSNSAPSWSPDGARVAYLSRRGSNPQAGFALMIRTMATGEDREVPAKVSIADRVSWFPDGRSVLAASRVVAESNLAFYRVDVESGAAQALLKTHSFGIVNRRPQISPDGRSVVYVDRVATGLPARRLVRHDLASGEETVLSRVEGNDAAVTSFAISPDGVDVAYLRADRQANASILEVVPLAGGPTRELFRETNLGRSRYSGLAWTRDKRYVLVTRTPDSSPTAASGLWKVPVAGGVAEMTGISLPGLIQLPSFDATDERVMFTGEGGGAGPAIWVVENFLPRAPR